MAARGMRDGFTPMIHFTSLLYKFLYLKTIRQISHDGLIWQDTPGYEPVSQLAERVIGKTTQISGRDQERRSWADACHKHGVTVE